MTHHTEAERAAFETWLEPEYSREKWNTGEYTDDTVFSMFAAWQAARRAPLVIDTRARYSGSIQELKQYASEDVDAMVHICNKHIGNVPKGFFLAMQECAALVGRAPAVPVPQGLVKDPEWQIETCHRMFDRMGIERDDGEDFYTVWGRVCLAFEKVANVEIHIPLCGEVVYKPVAAAPQPPEAEENPLQEQMDEALQSLEFYKRRCDLLQSIQARMRDPERTMVCDVLANGHLLQGGDGQPDKARYAPPAAAPVELPEPVYTMRVRGRMHDYTPTLSAFDLADGEHELYTEQQVRQLLAAHGIGKDKA